MRAFRVGQRVSVGGVDCGTCAVVVLPDDVAGTVARIRRDGGAWVRTDERVDTAGAHPFPADDEGGRGLHVLTYPEFCRALRRKEGRGDG